MNSIDQFCFLHEKTSATTTQNQTTSNKPHHMTGTTMRATWYEKNGSTEVLQTGSMEVPSVGAGQVLVRVHASGVNPSDSNVRNGWGGKRPMQYPRVIPHSDGAGVIEQVGPDVPTSRIGERVWIYEAQWQRPFGTAAEYVVVPAHFVVHLPDNTTFAQGAGLGIPAMTAHRLLFADGSVLGKTVLVTGGAGAVGYYAVQLAKWGGAAKVITTVSRPKQQVLAKEAGADFVINYKTEDVTARIREILGTDRGVDRVADVDFGTNLPVSEAVLKCGGVIASYATRGDLTAVPSIPFYSLLMNNITIQIVLVYTMSDEAKQAAVRDINAALSEGALKHNIAQIFSLHEVAAAHDAHCQDSGKMIGKVIIEIV
jgi:NADPH:quinone reductase